MGPGKAPLIQARMLELGYDGQRALFVNMFTIDADSPAIIGLRGPNGSGKSTFIKACLGLVRPMSGELRVMGLSPGRGNFFTMLEQIGYLPQLQSPGLMRLGVRELVAMGRYRRPGFFSRRDVAARTAVQDAMERCGIAHLAQVPVQELSGGQYQRTLLARALAREPKLLILDEPTSGLDAEGRAALIEIIESVADQGRRMLLVTHEEKLLGLCGGILRFGNGRLLAETPRGARDSRPGTAALNARDFA